VDDIFGRFDEAKRVERVKRLEVVVVVVLRMLSMDRENMLDSEEQRDWF
jgi:hypothetical protein